MEANELMRPKWCPKPDCLCIDSYGNVFCTGRMAKIQPHEDLFNTHNYCECSYDADGKQTDPENWEINYADATYIWKLMGKVMKDINDNALYKPKQDGSAM